MELNNLQHPRGARKSRKRIGRGPGSGHGKTSCKGHKGQKARTGGSINPAFEGGQMPLIRRLPKFGFVNVGRKEVWVINLRDLEQFDSNAVVDEGLLRQSGLVKGKGRSLIKVLGQGAITKALTVQVHAFSASAKKAIEAAGGSALIVGTVKSDSPS